QFLLFPGQFTVLILLDKKFNFICFHMVITTLEASLSISLITSLIHTVQSVLFQKIEIKSKKAMFDAAKPITMANDSNDIRLITALKGGDTDAFELIYKRMASKLLRFVNSKVCDRELSEEIVQEIFVSLWVRRHKLDADMPLAPYLFSAAKYRVLSHIRSEKVRHKYAEHFAWFVVQQQENSTENIVNEADLKAVIEEQISHLPPKCQR